MIVTKEKDPDFPKTGQYIPLVVKDIQPNNVLPSFLILL